MNTGDNIKSENSILKINKALQYERKGIIKEGEIEQNVVLKLPNGSYEGANSVIEILKLVDGKNTFSDIIILLKEEGIQIENESRIKQLLMTFLANNILSIT